MAAFTLAAISGGMDVILCAVLACSAPLAITSASSLPSMTALQPGIKSPHRSTFAIARPPLCYTALSLLSRSAQSPRSVRVANPDQPKCQRSKRRCQSTGILIFAGMAGHGLFGFIDVANEVYALGPSLLTQEASPAFDDHRPQPGCCGARWRPSAASG